MEGLSACADGMRKMYDSTADRQTRALADPSRETGRNAHGFLQEDRQESMTILHYL